MYSKRYKKDIEITDKQKVIAAISVVLVIALLVAVWVEFIRKPRVKITFDPMNGEWKKVVKVNIGGTALSPSTPSKEGYSFQFWTEDGKTEFDLSVPVNEDHYLTAKYLKTCKVDFVSDGEVFYTDDVIEGGKVRLPSDVPIKAGYVFDYWELNGSRFDFAWPITTDTVFTAHFRERIACTSVSFVEQTVLIGANELLKVSDVKLVIEPSDCTDTPVFSIEDKSIADITDDGVINGLAPGTTSITVTVGDQKATAEFICASPVEYITLDKEEYVLEIGESVTVKPDLQPAESSVYKLQYMIDDGNIAFVDERGVVTGRQGGTAKLTVMAPNGILVSAKICVNGSTLEMTGVPSSLFTAYDSSGNIKIPVGLVYREWKNGVEIIDTECKGALLQCNINVLKYSDGYLWQSAPVNASMSSEIYFTYMTAKSNSSFVICEPMLEVRDVSNLKTEETYVYSVLDADEYVSLTMNCTGEWSLISGDVSSFSSDAAVCSFIPGSGTINLSFTTGGGQTAFITIS